MWHKRALSFFLAACLTVGSVSPVYAQEEAIIIEEVSGPETHQHEEPTEEASVDAGSTDALEIDIVEETPATEQPVTETPMTEAPMTEAPMTETPATEAPAPETAETAAESTGEIIVEQGIPNAGMLAEETEAATGEIPDETEEEILIEEIEVVDEELEGTEIAISDEIGLTEASDAANAGTLTNARKRSLGPGLYAGITGTSYNGSYGGQLYGNYATVYQKAISHFVTSQSMEDIEVVLSDPLVFEVDYSSTGSLTGSIITNSDGYKNGARNEVRAIAQAANDALLYDCPEVFWIDKLTVSIKNVSVLANDTASSTATCCISKIILGAGERYSGAYGSRGTVNAGIAQACSDISAVISENYGSNPSTVGILKEIHDYVCENATYGQANGAEVSHTSAGFFGYSNKSVVCDGYAKAFSILCEKFGIQDAIVAGSAEGENHARNYVLLGGTYYLVDTTWDDMGVPCYDYFLKGWNSVVDGKPLSSSWVEFNGFSTSDYSSTFARPALSSTEYDVCGDTHFPGEGTLVEEFSCGSMWTYHCEICGKEFTSFKETEGGVHAWDNGTVIEEPSCTKEGRIQYTCTVCNNTRTETLPMEDHAWAETETIDKEATCKEEGMQSIHCLVCGTVKQGSESEIPQLAHTWSDDVIKVDPTCTDDGYTVKTCDVCGYEARTTVPAKGHAWTNSVTIDKSATCTAAGQQSIHCTACGAIKPGSQTVIPVKNHSFTVARKNPTCTAPGYVKSTCKACGYVKTETLAALGHARSSTMNTVTKATCTKAGKGEYRCTRCNAVCSTVSIPATGKHTYTAWTVKTPATIKAKAVQVRACTSCKKQETRTYGSVLKASLKLPASKVTMKAKVSKSYKVKIANGDSVAKYKSSNTKIVKVSGNSKGTFKLKAQSRTGSAYITITTKSKITKKFKVTVKPATKSIKNVPSKVTIKRGRTYKLKAKKYPTNAYDSITYKSSNSKIATVSKTGKITAKKKGKVTITVKCGSKVKRCKVTVR